HGADQAALVAEVVGHLRAADPGGLADVVDAGARDALAEHQVGGRLDDPLPGRAAFGCQPLRVFLAAHDPSIPPNGSVSPAKPQPPTTPPTGDRELRHDRS